MVEGIHGIAPSKWKRALQCDAISHWLTTYTEWSMRIRVLEKLSNFKWASIYTDTTSNSAAPVIHISYSYFFKLQSVERNKSIWQFNKLPEGNACALVITFIFHFMGVFLYLSQWQIYWSCWLSFVRGICEFDWSQYVFYTISVRGRLKFCT